MKVAAIIVTYNGEKYITECISSIVDVPEVASIIVIDNNSTDDTLNIVASSFRTVHIVDLKHNAGFGQANNIGFEIALKQGCDYYFLLNQDVYVDQETIPKLVQNYQNNPDYGIVAPIQLDAKGKSIDEKFYQYLFYQNRNLGYKILKNELEGVFPVDFVNAAAWMISKDCLLKVGGFDPVFFHTGEDDDYVQRVKYWGFKVGIVPETFVRHDRPQVNWLSQTTGVGRELTLNILGLKNLDRSYTDNLIQILKKKSYYVAYDIVKLRFKALKTKCVSLFKALQLTSSIKESRKRSLKEFAFLKK